MVKEKKILQKIISGGQTGVDQAALKAALELGFQIGGWCPPGRICENGKVPSEYTLIETENERSQKAPDIPRSQRTEYNVRDSDATLILKPYEIEDDPGTGWTVQCARQYKKAFFVIDPYVPDAEQLIHKWMEKTSPETLNIAGPAESVSQGIQYRTYTLLYRILANLKSDCSDYENHSDNDNIIIQ